MLKDVCYVCFQTFIYSRSYANVPNINSVTFHRGLHGYGFVYHSTTNCCQIHPARPANNKKHRFLKTIL